MRRDRKKKYQRTERVLPLYVSYFKGIPSFGCPHCRKLILEHEKTIINATVLYKTPELLNKCEKIIFVTAPFMIRLRRARRRDHLSYRQIFRRFRAQKNLLQEYQKSGIPIEIIKNE